MYKFDITTYNDNYLKLRKCYKTTFKYYSKHIYEYVYIMDENDKAMSFVVSTQTSEPEFGQSFDGHQLLTIIRYWFDLEIYVQVLVRSNMSGAQY